MLRLEMDKIGAELESSEEVCNMVEEFGNSIVSGDSWENDKIKELNIKPVKAINFMNFIRRFSVITIADDFNYVEGEIDTHAGSMHTHISFKENNTELNNSGAYVRGVGNVDNHKIYKDVEVLRNSSWANVLAPILFGKKPFSSRDCGLFYNTEDYCRGQLAYSEEYLEDTCSKQYAITRNTDWNTVEYRINENPMPLWVYWVPVLTANNELFKKLEKGIFGIYDPNNRDFLYRDDVKDLVAEGAKIMKMLLPLVIEHWKGLGMQGITNFRKIMKAYAREGFNSETVFHNTIKPILDSDRKWKSDYAGRI